MRVFGKVVRVTLNVEDRDSQQMIGANYAADSKCGIIGIPDR
jgi:hypothetical protein